MSKQNLSFVVDCSPLQQASPKPRHLKARFEQKLQQVSSALSLQAGIRRQSILDQTQRRCAGQNSHAKQVAVMRRQRSADILQQLNDSNSRAETKRNNSLKKSSEECRRQVQHAKDVAHAMSLKEKEQSDKQRTELEERLWRSELRRLMFQKIPRHSLLDEIAVEAEMMRANSSARRIQRWWRLVHIDSAIREFAQIGLHGTGAGSLTFETLSALFQNPDVLETTSRLLSQIKRYTAIGRSHRLRNPTKVFLAAYLIVFKTHEMMPDESDRDTALLEAGRVMLVSFDHVIKRDYSKMPSFVSHWQQFHKLFDSWKVKDTEKIISQMETHFRELNDLWTTVRDNVDAQTIWKPKIEGQLRVIRSRAVKIGGKSVSNRFQIQLTGENGATPVAISRSSSVTQLAQQPPEPEKKSERLEQVMSDYGALLSNERIAHEIVLDPKFELKPEQDGLGHQVKFAAKRAYFEIIRHDFEDGTVSWVNKIVPEVASQLLSMVPANSSMGTTISNVLDERIISQQVMNGVFKITELITNVMDLMMKLCAPIRDSEIRNISSLAHDPISQLEKILEMLEYMKLDLANYRIQSIRPYLMQQSVEYEKQKFAKALEDKRTSLDKTDTWLRLASTKVQTEVSRRNPENIDIPENRARFDVIFNSALLELVFSDAAISLETCPETLAMDAERIFAMQNEAQLLSVVASLAMLTRNFAPYLRDDEDAMLELKTSLVALLKDTESQTTVTHLSLHIVNFLKQSMDKRNLVVSDELEKTIGNIVAKTLSGKDAVYSLINRRVDNMVRQHLNSGRFRRDSNTGLDVIEDELEELSQKIVRLSKHNRQVYGSWYDEIIRKSLDQ